MDSEDGLFIMYTSGTTNKPKAILHTQAGYLLYAAATHKVILTEKLIGKDYVLRCYDLPCTSLCLTINLVISLPVLLTLVGSLATPMWSMVHSVMEPLQYCLRVQQHIPIVVCP